MAQQRPAPRAPSGRTRGGRPPAPAKRGTTYGGSGGRRPPNKRDARRRQTGFILGGTAVVAVVVVVVLLVTLLGGGSKTAQGNSPAPAGVTVALSSVSPQTLQQIGLQQPVPVQTTGAAGQVIEPTNISGSAPPLTANGKPEMLYLGAEYCPYCAAERWAMAIALSQFGHFDNLQVTQAPALDNFAKINTLSFHGATYTSPYLTFRGVEEQTPTGQTLDTPTNAEQKLAVKYANQPWGTGTSKNSYGFPFIDFGNQVMIDGATYSPAIVAGQSYEQIVAALNNPSSDISKSVGATANFIVASICKMTGGKGPNNICSSPVVTQAQSHFQAPSGQRH